MNDDFEAMTPQIHFQLFSDSQASAIGTGLLVAAFLLVVTICALLSALVAWLRHGDATIPTGVPAFVLCALVIVVVLVYSATNHGMTRGLWVMVIASLGMGLIVFPDLNRPPNPITTDDATDGVPHQK